MKTKNKLMKTFIINLFLLPALIAGLNLIPAGRVTEQTFTTLHSFTGGSDGMAPSPGLILSGNTLYGAAEQGGSSDYGTVFAVQTNGTGFTILHSFTGSDGSGPAAGLILSGNTLYGTAGWGGSSGNGTVFAVQTNGTGFTTVYSFTGGSDGSLPVAGLILSGNTLYGTAYQGGSGGAGTVFAVHTDGTGFTILHSFTAVSGSGANSDGANPWAGLILYGNTLDGTAYQGGSGGAGTVFAVHTDGTGFTILHSFTAVSGSGANSDGANPWAGLILYGNTLDGTAYQGGSGGAGTVFAVHTDGTGFTILHSFTAVSGSGANSDGANPWAGLILSGNTLYGTAEAGGSSGDGTVFAVQTNGTGFTTLHSFTAAPGPDYTNSDGANPDAGLILSGTTLYGTALQGGSGGNGTVFAVNTNGTGFMNLHSFTAAPGPDYTNSDGANPYAGLILSGTTLYGTAGWGGSSGDGTVFSLSLGSVSAPVPTLTIIPFGANVILTWPTDAAGFTLQSTTNLVSPVVWSIVSPGPIVIGGQNLVINPISGTRKFYRLSQ